MTDKARISAGTRVTTGSTGKQNSNLLCLPFSTVLILPPRLRPSYSPNLLEYGVGRRCTQLALEGRCGAQCKISSAGHELECSTPNHSYLFQVISLFLHQRRTTGFLFTLSLFPQKDQIRPFLNHYCVLVSSLYRTTSILTLGFC